MDCQHIYREDAACWWIRRTNRLSQIKWGWARQYLELRQAADGEAEPEYLRFLTRYTDTWARGTMQKWWEMGNFFWAYYARGW